MAGEAMMRVQPMSGRHHGWNYETPRALFQLWAPDDYTNKHRNWAACWTERREVPADYLDDEDDGWHPDGDYQRGATPQEAMGCFPHNIAGNRARRDLLDAALGNDKNY